MGIESAVSSFRAVQTLNRHFDLLLFHPPSVRFSFPEVLRDLPVEFVGVCRYLRKIPKLFFLMERIASLETRVAQLEAGNSLMVEADGSIDLSAKENRFVDEQTAMIVWPPAPIKRGRRPRTQLDEFVRRRDDLIIFIEIRWSDLENVMANPKSPEHLLRTIESASPGAHTTWGYKQLTEYLGALWEFLNSDRYKGEPRQIANAMAGAPEMKGRSSLDLGTKYPSSLEVLC